LGELLAYASDLQTFRIMQINEGVCLRFEEKRGPASLKLAEAQEGVEEA